MYFTVNFKMKKPKLRCYFTWIVLIELYFSCISVNRKTWEDRFAGKVGGWGVLRNGENPSNRGDDFEMGGEVIPLYRL